MSEFVVKKYDLLSSTQDKVDEYFELPKVCVVADRQSMGRGRNGRAFLSELGGLYTSIAFDIEDEEKNSPFYVLKMGVAAANALKRQGVEVNLKFPNDLIYKGKKLGGIISKCALKEGKISRITFGIGINITNGIAPEIADIALNLSGLKVDKELLLTDLLDEVESVVIKGKKADVLQSYKALSCTLGKKISVNCQPKIEGLAVNLDEYGYLLVKTEYGLQRVSYGDVSQGE